MIASFSFEISPAATVLGLIIALCLTAIIGLSGRVLLTSLLSSAAWGAIAFIVALCGKGGILGFGYLVLGVLAAAMLGAVFGGCWAMVMRKGLQESQGRHLQTAKKTPDDNGKAP